MLHDVEKLMLNLIGFFSLKKICFTLKILVWKVEFLKISFFFRCRFCGLVYIDQMIHSKTLVRAHLAKHKENKLPLPENFPDQPESSGILNSPKNTTLNGSFNPTFNSTRYGIHTYKKPLYLLKKFVKMCFFYMIWKNSSYTHSIL